MPELECWVCGGALERESDLPTIMRWLLEHEHTIIERRAARIVKAEELRVARERKGFR